METLLNDQVKVNRYQIISRKEHNAANKLEDIWYIRDRSIKKHGSIIAKFYDGGLIEPVVEFLNGYRKLSKAKKRRLASES